MKLLDRAREFLRGRDGDDATLASADLEVRAAIAVLLIEAAYGDEEYEWREHRSIVKGLEREFGIGRREVQELLGRAEEIRPPVVTLKDVTDVIRSRLDPQQRREVLRLLWRVIDADGEVQPWESAFADHVAGAVGLDGEEARALR